MTWHFSYCLFYSITHRGFLWLFKKLQVSLILVCLSYLIVIYVGKICKEQQVILNKMAGMFRCKLWYFNCIAGPPTRVYSLTYFRILFALCKDLSALCKTLKMPTVAFVSCLWLHAQSIAWNAPKVFCCLKRYFIAFGCSFYPTQGPLMLEFGPENNIELILKEKWNTYKGRGICFGWILVSSQCSLFVWGSWGGTDERPVQGLCHLCAPEEV